MRGDQRSLKGARSLSSLLSDNHVRDVSMSRELGLEACELCVGRSGRG